MSSRKLQINCEIVLKNLIPAKLSKFCKLEAGTPYQFERWDKDRSGYFCLYYWFKSRNGLEHRIKRVIVDEILGALQHLRATRTLNRTGFRTVCPESDSSGPCGFAVVGRILEGL